MSRSRWGEVVGHRFRLPESGWRNSFDCPPFMTIPKRIIQTGKSRDLHPLARASAANMKLLHPGWEIRFFDDADVLRFITEEFPEYRRVFDSFPRAIQRFDFFRYLAVYRLGGFYFDLDVFLWS